MLRIDNNKRESIEITQQTIREIRKEEKAIKRVVIKKDCS
jgi:hypothetical protein